MTFPNRIAMYKFLREEPPKQAHIDGNSAGLSRRPTPRRSIRRKRASAWGVDGRSSSNPPGTAPCATDELNATFRRIAVVTSPTFAS